MKDRPPLSLGLSTPGAPDAKASNAEAAGYDRTHCPVCNWEVEPATAKCPFCGADFEKIWQRRGTAGIVANTLFAGLKLLYVPVIYWAIGYDLFTSWIQVLPLYHRDPHLALAHWVGAVHGTRTDLASSFLFLFFFALLWIVMCWPNDVNPAGPLLNGLCTWILFFPLPLLVLLAVNPGLAHPMGEMIDATLRYLMF